MDTIYNPVFESEREKAHTLQKNNNNKKKYFRFGFWLVPVCQQGIARLIEHVVLYHSLNHSLSFMCSLLTCSLPQYNGIVLVHTPVRLGDLWYRLANGHRAAQSIKAERSVVKEHQLPTCNSSSFVKSTTTT